MRQFASAPMQSSDRDHKNLSETIGTTSEARQNEGTPRDDSTPPETPTGTLAHTVGLVRALPAPPGSPGHHERGGDH